MATIGSRLDIAHRHNFKVEIDGATYVSFQEVTGLEFGFDVVEYREGGNWSNTLKFRGQAKAGNITLKRGIVSAGSTFFEWIQDTKGSRALVRKSGSIVLTNDSGAEIRRWDFTQAWPASWRLGELNSGGEPGLVLEELVLAVDTIQPHGGAGAGGGR